MKRIIGAIAAGVISFSGIYALAASLNVSTPPDLGAYTHTVASCTGTDSLSVSYAGLAYTAGTGYTLTGVTVTDTTGNFPAACTGHDWQVTAEETSPGTTQSSPATGNTVTSGTNSFTYTFGAAQAAANLSGIDIVIA